MCGITGIIAFKESGRPFLDRIESSLKTLSPRGPDGSGIFRKDQVALGHSRLKIIDISDNASQPMTDPSGRYTIIFNGEIFNFQKLRNVFKDKGIVFRSSSDTEVLLHLFIHDKEKCLEKLEGDFAFAVYDSYEGTFFMARDRFGVKPLLYYFDEEKFIFASEMKAIQAFNLNKEIDHTSLFTYLQLNYIPAPHTIFKKIMKLEAGGYIKFRISPKLNRADFMVEKYYQVPHNSEYDSTLHYSDAKKKLIELLNESVQRRLISDVPLGTFLSGGIDSSVITALAANNTKSLNTFSIGYKDEPFYDETKYAALVSKKYNTNHTVFSLTNSDLFEHLNEILDYIDEPFADSSAIAVNILSRETKKYVTVALSGDGADEIFSGYNKHSAEFSARNPGQRELLVKLLNPLWKSLPKSRNSPLFNKVRQLQKFAEGMNYSDKDRYWNWAVFQKEEDSKRIFTGNASIQKEFDLRKSEILKYIDHNFNSVLLTDVSLVLQNDMLHKVDSMSMANGLEVRVPFLDHQVVNFIFSLPVKYKIDREMKKKILQDAFRSYLPDELYNRKKHGFEVPLLKWFRTEMKSTLSEYLLNEKFIKDQNIFDAGEIKKMVSRLSSANPGDAPGAVWNLFVFQHWWKKTMC